MKVIKNIHFLYFTLSILFISLVCYDSFIGGEYLKRSLPLPENLLLFNAFFILPHIIFSYFVFFLGSKDNHKVLKSNIMIVVVYFSLYISLLYYDISFFIFTYLIHGTYHLVMQQVGLCKVNGFIFQLLKVTALSLGLIIVFKCYSNYHIPYVAKAILFLLVILLVYFRTNTFVFSNVFLLASMCILFILEYSVLSLFLIRIAHDLTAFYFYSIHESNRRGLSLKIAFLKIYSISILANLSLLYFFGEKDIFLFDLSINLFILLSSFLAIGHYALESSMWKSSSPNRRFIY
ncbi:hypothetical protein [Vibrio crassostreae]|uniref:hypothetical protein n=1 Tax=Vibrio crassostreae TaxID=246167 RepID=UPI001BD53633|nr:hypothetical protein [Vibrio crassostreae]